MGEIRTFHTDIRKILQNARNNVYSAVNTVMVEAYWLIGQRIVEEQQQGDSKAKYGKRLIEELSIALHSELGKGFSYANLCNFRQF